MIKAEYIYDAWGKHIVINHDNNNIGDLNPFRDRGYYYDVETDLYYLQSRYYDARTGRFLNADIIGILNITKNTINGLNLYIYANNNPIRYEDPTGWGNIGNSLAV